MQIVVLGTSLLWGQGLYEDEKAHNVLAKMIREKHPGETIGVTFLAHSGARTGFKPDGTLDTTQAPRLVGEIPTHYPTVLQQIDEFDGSGRNADEIDVILLDTGINDVSLNRIFDPLIQADELEALIETYCHQHAARIVEKLALKFKNAKIIIAAYYEMITENSEESYLQALVKGFGKIPGGILIDVGIGLVNPLIKKRLLANCDIFAGASLQKFQQVAADANLKFAGRVFVADPNIKDEHAAFTADPWLFGINDDLTSQDPLAGARTFGCEAAVPARSTPFLCEHASVGHPNPKGAEAYASAFYALLRVEAESGQ